MLSGILLSILLQSFVFRNVVMLCVVMLSVAAPIVNKLTSIFSLYLGMYSIKNGRLTLKSPNPFRNNGHP
jgi:hypothetical protein